METISVSGKFIYWHHMINSNMNSFPSAFYLTDCDLWMLLSADVSSLREVISRFKLLLKKLLRLFICSITIPCSLVLGMHAIVPILSRTLKTFSTAWYMIVWEAIFCKLIAYYSLLDRFGHNSFYFLLSAWIEWLVAWISTEQESHICYERPLIFRSY